MDNERTPLILRAVSVKASSTSRPRRCSCGRILKLIFILIIACLLAILRARSKRRTVSNHISHDFGVGFDLSCPYGTASISYSNGTILDIEKIEASGSYQAMCFQVSLASSWHNHHGAPYSTIGDALCDKPRQLLRNSRKAVGLPASPTVGKLANLLIALRDAVESRLGQRIYGAVGTIPHLVGLYREDLEDAFEHAGLLYINTYPYYRHDYHHDEYLSENGAVYAGNGLGLCTNYTDTDSCDEAEKYPPFSPGRPEMVLLISYTETMLTSTLTRRRMGFATSTSDENRITNLTLGWDRRDTHDGEYWAIVKEAIMEPVKSRNAYLPVDVKAVILYGEYVLDLQFQIALKDAIRELFPQGMPILSRDPVYSAARGAAEMAKRVWWRYNHTAKPLQKR